MIRRRARPLDASLTIESRVGETAQEGNETRHLVEDVSGVPMGERLADVASEALGDALGQPPSDPPVGSGLAWRRDRPAHPLHAALGVGERPLLLSEAG